jgi:hypothetical protein
MRQFLSCVYCGEEATTSDHVIPRCLLEKPYPSNLPTVPSCADCNNGYSKDEEYFLAAMAQSGSVPSLLKKVEEGGVVDRMLSRSIGLYFSFLPASHVNNDGRIYITPDVQRMANVAQKIAFGLFITRYRPRVTPPRDSFFALKPMHDQDTSNLIMAMAHTEKFTPRRWIHVQPLPGQGRRKVQIFDYMFVRNWIDRDFGKLFCIMRFHETVWAAVRCPNPSTAKAKSRRPGASYAEHGRLPLLEL